MSYLYNKIRNEILTDHEQNNYMQAVEMSLRDKSDKTKEQQVELKEVAKQLTADENFPYKVFCTLHNDHMQTNTMKMSYKSLKK